MSGTSAEQLNLVENHLYWPRTRSYIPQTSEGPVQGNVAWLDFSKPGKTNQILKYVQYRPVISPRLYLNFQTLNINDGIEQTWVQKSGLKTS